MPHSAGAAGVGLATQPTVSISAGEFKYVLRLFKPATVPGLSGALLGPPALVALGPVLPETVAERQYSNARLPLVAADGVEVGAVSGEVEAQGVEHVRYPQRQAAPVAEHGVLGGHVGVEGSQSAALSRHHRGAVVGRHLQVELFHRRERGIEPAGVDEVAVVDVGARAAALDDAAESRGRAVELPERSQAGGADQLQPVVRLVTQVQAGVVGHHVARQRVGNDFSKPFDSLRLDVVKSRASQGAALTEVLLVAQLHGVDVFGQQQRIAGAQV